MYLNNAFFAKNDYHHIQRISSYINEKGFHDNFRQTILPRETLDNIADEYYINGFLKIDESIIKSSL